LEHGDLVAQGGDLGLLGSAGLKCRGKPSEQGNEDGTHCENDDDLTNDLTSNIFNPDGVLGNDTCRLLPSPGQPRLVSRSDRLAGPFRHHPSARNPTL
jgi:hypothetical protein